MKFTRSILGGALAALAVVALLSGVTAMDHVHAANGLSGIAVAMAGMVTIKAPVTVFYNGQYVGPGTPISVSEQEALRLTAAHGSYGSPGEVDPANTQMRNVDIASIAALNEHTGIHKGTGVQKGSGEDDSSGVFKRSDLDRMNRDKLVETAADLHVAHDADATRAQLIDAIMAAQEAAKA